MAEKHVVRVVCKVLRSISGVGPVKWVRGDYTKIYSDGSEGLATYDEYLIFLDLPLVPNIEVIE